MTKAPKTTAMPPTRCRQIQLGSAVIVFLAFTLSTATGALGQGRSWPAERSGPYLPPPDQIAFELGAAGIYAPKVESLGTGNTGLVEGLAVWNLNFGAGVGLFGQHSLSRFWFDNIVGWAPGTEIGIRYLANTHFAVEAAYLSHRLNHFEDTDQSDSKPIYVGGFFDRGVELKTWFVFQIHDQFRLAPALLTRVFRVYTANQGVVGLGLRAMTMPTERHLIQCELQLLRVVRSRPLDGVDRVTWNTIGTLHWRLDMTPSFGLKLGARLSTHMRTGEVPYFEIWRSLIDQKMLFVLLGVHFFV